MLFSLCNRNVIRWFGTEDSVWQGSSAFMKWNSVKTHGAKALMKRAAEVR